MSEGDATMPTPTFASRVESGLYDEMALKLKGLRTTFLGNAIFNEHFAPSIIEWSKNQMYRGLDHNEFRCNIFGELSTTADGTAIGAAGAFRFEGTDGSFEPLRDNIKVKDRFVLKCPTEAPVTLVNMFNNQIATLNDAREFDEAKEKAANKDPLVFEQWTKCSKAEPADAPADMLCVSMGPKYTVPSATNNKRSPSSSPPKKRLRRQEDDTPPQPPSSIAVTAPDAGAEPAHSSAAPVPTAAQVGDLYDPASQPDYRGPGYELREARLVQRDVRDIHGNLVHPRDYHSVMRPGSLVLINATLHCYIMAPTERNTERNKRERKYYQINAHSIRIVAESPLGPEGPAIPTTSGSRRNVGNGGTSDSTKAYEDFALTSASPSVTPSSSPAAGSSSSPASRSMPADGATANSEDGEVDLPLEYVDESPSVKGKKPSGRRHGNGKRGRGDNDGMDFE